MLKTFNVADYRNVRARLNLERINLLVGPNNAGKSNLINALLFVKSLFTNEGRPSGLLQALEEQGRGEILNRRLKKPNRFSIEWYATLQQNISISHKFQVLIPSAEEFPSGFRFYSEKFKFEEPDSEAKTRFISCHHLEGEPRLSPKLSIGEGAFGLLSEILNQGYILSVDPQETALRQSRTFLQDKKFYEDFYKHFDLAFQATLSYFGNFDLYSSTHFDLASIHEGATTDLSVRTLDRRGTQLVNVLRYIDQHHDLSIYTEKLRELIRDLDRVKIIDVSDTRKQIEVRIGGSRFRPRELSDGTLKAMLLASLLWNPQPLKLLALDEPELNLHPSWLKVLGTWLQRGTGAEQLFISTHSPDLLDTFTEGYRNGEVALFVCTLGEAGIERVEPQKLDSFFQQGWELGDLYRVGEPQLGGWPW